MSPEVQSEQAGRVVGLAGDFALVQVVGGGCGRCHETGGCGGQQLTQMFCSSPRSYRVRNPLGAKPGDLVTVVLPAGTLRRHATLGYGLPLLGLLAGGGIGDSFGGEAGGIFGAVGGLVLAWLVLRGATLVGDGPQEPFIGRIRSGGGSDEG